MRRFRFARIPGLMSSRTHITGLALLGIYLIILPALGVHVPVRWELIGGNYTNVTSDIGACIAAGAGTHIIRANRASHRRMIDEFDRLHQRIRLLEGKPDSEETRCEPSTEHEAGVGEGA